MAFVDQLQLNIAAGRGGDGVVRWRHEKHKEFGGPAGGDGGAGGDVYVVAQRELHDLSRYVQKTHIAAENGALGGNYSKTGKRGQDLILYVPVGTILTNTETGEVFECMEPGEQQLILSGGEGGYGNEHFKSATNQRPEEATEGARGEHALFRIELKLIADIGLLGFPSAGKTSMLNTLTNASAKTGAYHFTTLSPNLGAYYGYIIADIPGLIEGAHEGKGLGDEFLRHITRTSVLIHLISIEHDTQFGGTGLLDAYQKIRHELEAFDATLLEKPELVVLTKVDMGSKADISTMMQTFNKQIPEKEIALFSIHDETLLEKFTTQLSQFLNEHIKGV